MKNMKNRFFWIDLEMSGLNEKTDSILEVAIVVTDLDFHPVEEYHQIVFQPPEVLEQMNDWCKKTHGASGLTQEVPHGKKIDQVETEIIQLIDRHFQFSDPQDNRVVLVGNSIGNDRRFIDRYLPEFSKRLHYRMIDVSSFKEVFRSKYGLSFQKQNAHRATGDVYESIRELKFYLSHVQAPTHG
jgi:oligoribonuclease